MRLQLRPLYVLLALSAAPLAAHAGPTYTVAAITPLGAAGGEPNALNNAGQVAGYVYSGGSPQAYVTQNGVATNLHPAAANGGASQARGINDSGTVVGEVTTRNGPTQAVVFSNGSVQNLGTLGGQTSTAYGINAGGQVVGSSATSSGDIHAFMTKAGGGLLDIGTLGGSYGEAFAINDNGAATGYAATAQDEYYRAFVYANGSMQALATLGGDYVEGTAINNSGMVAGESYLAGDTVSHAFLYANGIAVDLGAFGGNDSFATGINEAGSVVGASTLDSVSGYHAFLYSNGILNDLNDLIDPSLGWTLTYAGDINDKGQIAAYGCKAANQCASLLLSLADTGGTGDPSGVPEPEAFSAAFAGLALLGLLRRRRAR